VVLYHVYDRLSLAAEAETDETGTGETGETAQGLQLVYERQLDAHLQEPRLPWHVEPKFLATGTAASIQVWSHAAAQKYLSTAPTRVSSHAVTV
jgi:hypothetical protein